MIGEVGSRAADAVGDLLRRQTEYLGRRLAQASSARGARGAGSVILTAPEVRPLLASAGVGSAELESCLTMARRDRRFAFLDSLTDSQQEGIIAALEEAFFKSRSEAVSEMTTLMKLFVVVLDGLLDSIPELLEPERPRLRQLMSADSWARGNWAADGARFSSHAHPVVELLLRIGGEIMKRLKDAVRQTDALLWSVVPSAVEEALLAEYDSLVWDFGETQRNRLAICRSALRGKSIASAWIFVLVPMSIRGWPQGLDLRLYRRFAESLGALVGWMDDLGDIIVDLESDRWSEVLLDLFDYADAGLPTSRSQLTDQLLRALGSDSVRSKLAATGQDRFEAFTVCLDELGIDCTPVYQSLAIAQNRRDAT